MSDEIGYRLVQRWLKRVRKSSKLQVRYACVAEHGGSATYRLHYHLVVHGPTSLTQRMLRSKWRGGISEASLVSGNAANVAQYTSKLAGYVTKGSSRFRFSAAYGSQAVNKIMRYTLVAAAYEHWPDARLRVGGVKLHYKLQPHPVPVWVPDPDLMAEIEDTRKELEYSRAINDRRSRQIKFSRR
jgi:hypothetical protein